MRLATLPFFAAATLCLAAMLFAAEPSTAPAAPVAANEPIHIVLDGAKRPGECVPEGRKVQQELQTLHYPPGWTVAIMCTPIRWNTILQQADVRNTDAAFTRISARLTVLNGNILRTFPPNYRHIMAHELAHIQCKCADEGKAEDLARELEKKN